MTDSAKPESPELPPAKPSEVNIDKPNAKSGRGLSLFATLLAVLALAGSAFTWYQAQVERVAQNSDLAIGVTEIGGDVARLGDAVARVQAEQNKSVSEAQLSAKVLEATSNFDLRLRDIDGNQNELRAAIDKVKEDMQKGVNDFVVDEVSQLLKLANNSALFSSDTTSAIKALSLADIQLKELADPRFSEVRRKINEEIAVLKGIEPLDFESLTARLNALAKTVPDLPLANEPPAQSKVKIVQDTQAEEVSWRSELRQMWRDIINSIQVQRVDQPPKPLLAPQQRYFLNQNLQLNFAKAELALLQNYPTIYLRSLEDAEQWLSDYFDLKNSDVLATLAEIKELKETELTQELPSVAESYDLLQSIKGRL